MPSETETAARVQGVLDIPLNRFLGMELRDPADPAAGIWSRWPARRRTRRRCCTAAW